MRQNSGYMLNWDCLFVLPEWLKVWWTKFNNGAKSHLISIRKKEMLLGLAPLQKKNNRVSFIGNTDVCDYLDFIVAARTTAIGLSAS